LISNCSPAFNRGPHGTGARHKLVCRKQCKPYLTLKITTRRNSEKFQITFSKAKSPRRRSPQY
jgi:hypothetical protein